MLLIIPKFFATQSEQQKFKSIAEKPFSYEEQDDIFQSFDPKGKIDIISEQKLFEKSQNQTVQESSQGNKVDTIEEKLSDKQMKKKRERVSLDEMTEDERRFNQRYLKYKRMMPDISDMDAVRLIIREDLQNQQQRIFKPDNQLVESINNAEFVSTSTAKVSTNTPYPTVNNDNLISLEDSKFQDKVVEEQALQVQTTRSTIAPGSKTTPYIQKLDEVDDTRFQDENNETRLRESEARVIKLLPLSVTKSEKIEDGKSEEIKVPIEEETVNDDFKKREEDVSEESADENSNDRGEVENALNEKVSDNKSKMIKMLKSIMERLEKFLGQKLFLKNETLATSGLDSNAKDESNDVLQEAQKLLPLLNNEEELKENLINGETPETSTALESDEKYEEILLSQKGENATEKVNVFNIIQLISPKESPINIFYAYKNKNIERDMSTICRDSMIEYFGDAENKCNSFYMCWNKHKFHIKCNKDERFNIETQNCQPKEMVNETNCRTLRNESDLMQIASGSEVASSSGAESRRGDRGEGIDEEKLKKRILNSYDNVVDKAQSKRNKMLQVNESQKVQKTREVSTLSAPRKREERGVGVLMKNSKSFLSALKKCQDTREALHFADYTSGCKHFFICRYGRIIREKCPSLTLFNLDLNLCDYQKNINRKTCKQITT